VGKNSLKGVTDDICWFGFTRELFDHHCSGCSRAGDGEAEKACQQWGYNLALSKVQVASGSSSES